MRRLIISLTFFGLLLLTAPGTTLAASGIFASGGGTFTAGQNFTVAVTASGNQFDSLQGTISVSGPVSIVSFAAGNGTWLPGKSPSNGVQFVGIVSPTSSFRVATIVLRGTRAGSGSVSVSGAALARNGSYVGTDSGGTSFTINRAPIIPGVVTVTSSSHPDQSQAYTATTINLSWNKEGGIDGFSYLLDTTANTIPPAKITSNNTSTSYANQAVGTYYFHIRAHDGDGWGPTTNFKITIKLPDPTVDTTLTKPIIQNVIADSHFAVNVDIGTVTGIIIEGTDVPNYTTNVIVEPSLTPPDGTTLNLSPVTDAQGNWSVVIDFPIKSGFYKVTAQGQLDRVLTPTSDMFRFELDLTKGGSIHLITSADAFKPAPPPVDNSLWHKITHPTTKMIIAEIVSCIVLIAAAVAATAIILIRKHKLNLKSIKEKL